MNRLREYLTNTTWLAFERLFRMALGLVGWLYIARYLGPEGYGLLNYALSFVGLFAAVAALGVDQLLMRELVRYPSAQGRLLGTSTGLRLAGSSAAISVITLILLFMEIDWEERALVWIISVSLLLQALGGIESYFAAQVRSRYVVYVQTTQSVLSLALRVVLVELDAPLVWFAIALTVDNVLLYLGLVWMYKRTGGQLSSWCFDLDEAKRLLHEAWPLIFTGIFVTIYFKVDQVMLKILAGDGEAGIYAAAVKLSETWYFIPAIITTSVFPAIISAREAGRALYEDRLQDLYDLMTLLSVGLALFVSFLATPLIGWVFGPEFLAAGPVLALHIWAGVLIFGGFVRQRWVLAENLQGQEAWLNLAGAGCNVLFNFLLIPEYGAFGAAVATVLSYFVGLYLVAGLFRDFRPFFRMYNVSFAHLLSLRVLRKQLQ